MPEPKLILASTSPYRRELLQRLGVTFRCEPPHVDEDDLKAAGLAPRDLASRLALAKAAAVSAREPTAVVIGSDQVCAIEGTRLSKPGSREAAVAQLQRLAGRTHELHTAVSVLGPASRQTAVDSTRLRMRPLSLPQIERYVDRDRPYDCVGAYKLECAGITLFEAIESEDHTAITGLPLIAVVRMLGELGFELP